MKLAQAQTTFGRSKVGRGIIEKLTKDNSENMSSGPAMRQN